MTDESKNTWWYKLIPDELQIKISHLTAAERGVYFTLLLRMLGDREPLWIDHNRLARSMGFTPGALKKAIPVLQESNLIHRTEDGWWSEYAQKRLKEAQEKSRTAQKNARTRWEKHNKNRGSADAEASRLQCESNASNSNSNSNSNRGRSTSDVIDN